MASKTRLFAQVSNHENHFPKAEWRQWGGAVRGLDAGGRIRDTGHWSCLPKEVSISSFVRRHILGGLATFSPLIVYDVPSSSPQLSKFIGIAEVCRREADEEKTERGRKSALSRNQSPPFRSLLLPLRQKCPAVDAMARQRMSRGECLPRPVSSDYQRGS